MMAGGSFYHGELIPIPFAQRYKLLRPAGSLFLRYSPADWLGIRLGATATRLHGDARYNGITVYRDLPVTLRTPLQEAALTIELSPVALRLFGREVRPYGYSGIAVCRFEPRLRIDGQWVEMQPLGTEGQGLAGNPSRYRTTRWVLPLGVGLRTALSERVLLGVELNARFPDTDYLDDISGRSVNYPLLRAERGETIARISHPAATERTGDYERGNAAMDAYFYGGLSLHYRFSVGGPGPIGCPTF
jgi:hypothetical protein